MKKLLEWIKKEFLFVVFLLGGIVLLALFRPSWKTVPSMIDWRTIESLAGLLILTAGLRASGAFDHFASEFLVHLHSERRVAFFFIGISACLAAFLTNDVALFIVVPLTLSLQNVLKNDLRDLVFFEAIAVNAGSTLTPIGNPQNLFLWHQSGLSFGAFVLSMAPLALFLLALLALFTAFRFKYEKLDLSEVPVSKVNWPVFWVTLALMAAFIVLMELKLEWAGLVVVGAVGLFLFRKALLTVDWVLLPLFMLMFIDFNLLSRAEVLRGIAGMKLFESPQNWMLLSGLLSQITSNVPASIFLAQFGRDVLPVAYGVNLGGQGFVIGSLANLIALRILGQKHVLGGFHKWSVPFFVLSTAAVYAVMTIFG